MTRRRLLAITIFPDVEVLDCCGPFEVFSVANRESQDGGFEITVLAEDDGPILARGGLSLNPDQSWKTYTNPDILLVPGGQGVHDQLDNVGFLSWLTGAAAEAELVLSVCTGALLLGRAGLLHGLRVTTHHASLQKLAHEVPSATITNARYEDNGRIVTSAGIAAGIDMSLHIVARMLGNELARRTAQRMEYPWQAPASAEEESP